MAGYKTYLTVLQRTTQATPLPPALKISHFSSDCELQGWKDITYSQLLHDVEQAAKYWSRELSEKGIDNVSVIGSYFGSLGNAVVSELLSEAKAKGLIHDPAITVSVGENVFTFPAVGFLCLVVEQPPLAEINSPTSGEEVFLSCTFLYPRLGNRSWFLQPRVG
ncbi:hypothetical protein FVEG_17097 [Fusarium verticillioides 7600]|uniref:Uncharacterized protein n=1 Tax=Gibberella moniliformis (strain M3125 / FGSC 7600) TaxID=334819 RepID=W7MQG4_GIBM7|nr:hypothetical protein FVEG_17097 [Fusarium verticillioides 7600]EWG53351.1 hypothetical protein FVEG_17097 [Fusarium verticillioides 7600]